MARKTYTPEQIINKLREAEVLISQGTAQIRSRTIDVTEYCFRERQGLLNLSVRSVVTLPVVMK